MPESMLPFAFEDATGPVDDMMVEQVRGATFAGDGECKLRIQSRKRIIYGMMDSTHDMAMLANALRAVLKLNSESSRILCPSLCFSHTRFTVWKELSNSLNITSTTLRNATRLRAGNRARHVCVTWHQREFMMSAWPELWEEGTACAPRTPAEVASNAIVKCYS
jgi:hypothetical protein